ncbi:magnesium transporter [Anaerobacillus alkalidiazotrophicus]|uniref:Magnesium transporter MgtE n=1 Tax=Anaerobacillus alkalidiazotrophicus TaxID=472963 RepID=A0A1S2M2K1_9BACI|nr:magnesium transporter [Anaerobacillus alkalidiazotrophicus]OIJ18147.1 magnesium transporter [Anaerobacillus alkalidiazotrophicus]OIJ19626.1 magnesium transporter [Anaerobacillus alkalidiazotrophicus]
MKKITVKNREEFTYYLFLYLKNEDEERFREEFLELHPTDQNEIFKLMSNEKRKRVYNYITAREFADIFSGLQHYEQKMVFSELEDSYALEMLNELPADEITDFFSEIPEHISQYLLEKMDKTEADNIKHLLSYKENTAGSLMTTEFVTVLPSQTVSEIMERLRMEGTDAETIYYLYVTNDTGKLIGVVSLRELITASLNEKAEKIMKEQLISVSPLADQQEVSKVIKDYDFLAVPVVTSNGKIVGIVTVDDILDVIEEETSEEIGEISAVKGALDLEVSSMEATKKRLPWLILLLFIGMFTAGLISSFESTIAEVAMLAVFIPLIADMAGNTGTQSLAVVVRGLALDKFDRTKVFRLLKRESLTGLMMGIICGILVSIIALLIPQGNVILGFIIGTSLFVTILFSTISGTVIPLIVHKLKIDPAVASGPFITTINDFIGLLTYFSIATTLLHYL